MAARVAMTRQVHLLDLLRHPHDLNWLDTVNLINKLHTRDPGHPFVFHTLSDASAALVTAPTSSTTPSFPHISSSSSLSTALDPVPSGNSVVSDHSPRVSDREPQADRSPRASVSSPSSSTKSSSALANVLGTDLGAPLPPPPPPPPPPQPQRQAQLPSLSLSPPPSSQPRIMSEKAQGKQRAVDSRRKSSPSPPPKGKGKRAAEPLESTKLRKAQALNSDAGPSRKSKRRKGSKTAVTKAPSTRVCPSWHYESMSDSA
ncbi:hypothetical protein C8F01DRAFT_1253693 [Mycena amicta]|nr:hypothetical protein C8F01DRAFT_1253693 [Mycena amicta]